MMADASRSFEALVPYHDVERPCNWPKLFQRHAPLTVEIGFGLGEILLRKAQEQPEVDFVGIELHWERILKALKKTGRLSNIRVLSLDATVAMERLFAERSIDFMYSLFPCPWPKKKHIKHRLFSRQSLRLINSRLKPKARLYLVTDHYPYVEWIKEECRGCGFTLRESAVKTSFGTKFEKKWRGEGQETFFEVEMTKTRHISVPVKRDAVLKNYKLDRFDPAGFQWRPAATKSTVIFKGMNYDPLKKEALIHSIVAEEHLTQHFWISVKAREKDWIIKPMEGQNVFATPGIAEALHTVYVSARKPTHARIS